MAGCPSPTSSPPSCTNLFLELGPGEDAIRRALSSVVCALSDMGAEIAIAEARDCLPEFMAKGVVPTVCTGGVSDHRDFLFPNALQVPGPIHIVDLVLRTAVSESKWWSGFQLQLKDLLQWFHPQHHRTVVEKAVVDDPHVDSAVRDQWVASLSRRPEKFADWRWLRRALRSSTYLRDLAV